MDINECFEGRIDIDANINVGADESVGLLTVKFVHYPGTPEFPGSQQLILWLPTTGYQGYTDLMLRRAEQVVDIGKVADRLNGSVQILLYTLTWSPGPYVLTVAHEAGWHHQLEFTKQEPGAPEPVVTSTSADEDESSESDRDTPIVYRDGFGNIMPDQDLIIRDAALASLARRFSRKVTYKDQGRAGTVIYTDGDRTIEFSHEMAGGGYSWLIDIPTPAQWEAQTGTDLSERDEIVQFVAESAQRDQARTWQYEIRDDAILYYAPDELAKRRSEEQST